MNSPVRYYGGKGAIVQYLLQHVPPDDVYVTYLEAFAGGASLFFGKSPAKVDILNDIDSLVTNFYKVLRDMPDEFIRQANLIPYSREVHKDAKKVLKYPLDAIENTDLAKALDFFILCRQSMSGDMTGGWSHGKKTNPIGGWLSAIERLPEIVERLCGVQVENMNAIECIKKYDSTSTFIYTDPPYYTDSRVSSVVKSGHGYKQKAKSGYRAELPSSEHFNLLKQLHKCNGYVLLSGYHCKMYDDFFDEHEDWEVIDLEVVCQAAVVHGEGKLKEGYKRVEVLWKNEALCKAGHQLSWL